MKKKLPITKNKDVVVSWVYTWSKQQDMSIHEQRIVLRILEACQAELKGVKLKDYAGTKRKFEHGLWDVDAQMHVSDVIFSGRDYNEIIAALDSLAGRFFTYEDDEEWWKCGFISNPKYKKRTGIITFRVSNDLWNVFTKFAKGYREFELNKALALPTGYSLRFYMLMSGQVYPLDISLENLKDRLGIPADKYKDKNGKDRIDHFEERVLKPAKAALDGTVYGGADVYFSAITPSASGGQPASAYFMIRDGIPGYAATVALLINLVMYTLSLLTIGLLCMIFKYPLLKNFSGISRIFICLGIVVLIFLALVFYMLLRKGSILYSICDSLIRLFEKIHIIRHGDRLRIKLKNTMKEYQECSNSITGQTGLLIEIFFWNIMQRVSQLLVSFMIFMAVGEGVNKAVDVSVIQCFVAMGSNCVPIPGAMGVADYIMIDGFKQLVGSNAANMELLCRGMTFYGSVITSAVIILIGYIIRKKVAK